MLFENGSKRRVQRLARGLARLAARCTNIVLLAQPSGVDLVSLARGLELGLYLTSVVLEARGTAGKVKAWGRPLDCDGTS